jgi:transcriptional regulator with XRE-family HTH domain
MALTGRNVAAARALHGITQAELGAYLGVTRAVVIAVEKGRLEPSQDGLKGWVLAVEGAAKKKQEAPHA